MANIPQPGQAPGPQQQQPDMLMQIFMSLLPVLAQGGLDALQGGGGQAGGIPQAPGAFPSPDPSAVLPPGGGGVGPGPQAMQAAPPPPPSGGGGPSAGQLAGIGGAAATGNAPAAIAQLVPLLLSLFNSPDQPGQPGQVLPTPQRGRPA